MSEEQTSEIKVPMVDKVINKAISRKLSVFVVGTLFLVMGVLMPEQWMQLAVAYVGAQGFVDIVQAYKNGK